LGGIGAKVVAVASGSGEIGWSPGFSILLQVSSSSFEPGAWREASEEAGLAAGRVNVKEG
jgi:hypothetical protein